MHYHCAIVANEAHLDVKAQGCLGAKYSQDYFDVKVFNPYAKTYRKRFLTMVYSQLEQLERRLYDQHIRKVEHGLFTPLIFSSTGGLGRTANITFQRLTSLLAAKWSEPYSVLTGWLCCHISFSLTRSAIACLCGSRSTPKYIPSSVGLAVRESRLTDFQQN